MGGNEMSTRQQWMKLNVTPTLSDRRRHCRFVMAVCLGVGGFGTQSYTTARLQGVVFPSVVICIEKFLEPL